MSERVEEIRIRVHHLVHGAGPDPLPGTLVCEPCRRVTTALAQAVRERDQEKALRVKAIDRLDEVLTEVERLRKLLRAALEGRG